MPSHLDLTIESVAFRGVGLARHEGRIVFVPDTAPGDHIRARIVRARPDFLEARIATLISPGPDRRVPPCPLAAQCGGCALMHLSPEAQRRAKGDFIAQALRRQARLTVDPGPALSISGQDGYRRRATMFGTWERVERTHEPATFVLGFRRRASHAIVDIPLCMVLEPALSRGFETLRAVADVIGPDLGPLSAHGVLDSQDRVGMLVDLGTTFAGGPGRGGTERDLDGSCSEGGPAGGPDGGAEGGAEGATDEVGLDGGGVGAAGLRHVPRAPAGLDRHGGWARGRRDPRGTKGLRARAATAPLEESEGAQAVDLVRVARRLGEGLTQSGIHRVHVRGAGEPLFGGVPSVDGMADRLTFGSNALEYVFPVGGFIQANRQGNQGLIDKVIALVGPLEGAQVLDLFAGAGNIGLALAYHGAHATLVERNRGLAQAAEKTVCAAGLAGRARVLALGAADALAELKRVGYGPRCVVLDPPRTGARDVLAALTALRPGRIVYVSCDPATLARDVAILGRSGYALTHVEALDMFPQTYHVEAIAVLDPS